MYKIRVFNKVFNISLLGFSLYVIVFSLLSSLGFWQLNRAEQKRVYLAEQQAALIQTNVDDISNVIDIDASVSKYQQIKIHGRFDVEHQFLLDNRVHNGKPGFLVFTPLIFGNNSHKAVLINRGWLPLGQDRKHLPELPITNTQTELTGRINQFPGIGIKLAGAEIPTEGWPAIVQLIDNKVLASRLGYEIANVQIELDADSSEGYDRNWDNTTTIITPEKHIAYAVQWFALALTATGWFIWQSTRIEK